MTENRSPINPPAKVTVIGLGNMGRPMAACLARAGFDVTGFDLSVDARAQYVAAGGKVASDVAAAVADAAAIITLLPNGKIVRKAVEELIPLLAKGTAIIDMSSSAPVGTQALGALLDQAGLLFADAPVSGGVKRATDGSLAIMVGGRDSTIDVIDPVLAAMGKSIIRTGLLGSGHAAKALNNYVSAAGLAAAAEAVAIAGKFGLSQETMTDVLNASTGRNNSTENKLKQFMISETYSSGFSLALMAKDIRTADDLANEIGVPSPLADEIARMWDAASEELGPNADHTEIGRYLTKQR